MIYTNIQIVNAFCEMRGYNSETDGTKVEFIAKIEIEVQERLVNRREELEAQLAQIPTSARDMMRNRAVAYLSRKEAEQTMIDNEGVEL
jgi:hypothetical protein